MDLRAAFYDLSRLFFLHKTLESLDPKAGPTVLPLYPLPPQEKYLRVGVLCGSFNPLTRAHTLLARFARERFGLERVFLTLARVTVDKEQVSGMILEDRLLLLSLVAERNRDLGVALVNRGLYFEQAQAFHSFWGERVEVYFVVGMDKVVQILDPRYYRDREEALKILFGLASLAVANRGAMDERELEALLAKPENRPYRPYVHFFRLPTEVQNLSASAIRARLAAGERVGGEVPEEVEAFVAETGVYGPPRYIDGEEVDPYGLRVRLLQGLYLHGFGAEKGVRFDLLVEVALSPTEQGRSLRRLLDHAERPDFVAKLLDSPH